MKFSPDGRHLLGGIGNGRLYIDGVIPPELVNFQAGGWDWISNEIIGGQGSPDASPWHLYSFNLSTRELKTINSLPASWFYANGSGSYVVFLASRPPLSYDAVQQWPDPSVAQQWPDRVAFGRSPEGDDVFTNPSHNALLVRTAAGVETIYQTGPVFNAQMEKGVLFWCGVPLVLHAVGASSPKAPVSGAAEAVFTTLTDGRRFIVQWDAGIGALVVYEWVAQTDPGPLTGYALSSDGFDFNHDIKQRADGMLLVGTGVNQGETGQRLYELDLVNARVRCNGAAWSPLVLTNLDAPPVVLPVIDAFQHEVYVAPFFPNKHAPGNACIIANNQNYVDCVPDGFKIIASPTALQIAVPPSDRLIGIYNETRSGLTFDLADHYGVPLFVCQDNPNAYDVAVLKKLRPADWPMLECYLQTNETVDQAFVRVSANLKQLLAQWSGRIALAWQDYTQAWTVNVARLVDWHRFLSRLVNSDPRVAAVCPFAWDRSDGCDGVSWTNPDTGIIYYPSTDLAECVRRIANASPGAPSEVSMIVVPQVQVDSFTLDELKNGREFIGHDPMNPALGTRCRVWVENGSIFMEIAYPAVGASYVGRTGKARPVK